MTKRHWIHLTNMLWQPEGVQVQQPVSQAVPTGQAGNQ